jgi:hypothetical protein
VESWNPTFKNKLSEIEFRLCSHVELQVQSGGESVVSKYSLECSLEGLGE